MDEHSLYQAIASVLTTILVAAQDKALAPSDGCFHAVKIRWKDDKAVCVICRSILDNTDSWAISVTELPITLQER